MKCYLHIGTEKTATKTLQNFLEINREKLCQKGVIFLQSPGQSNHSKLAVAAYHPARADDVSRSMGIDPASPDGLEEFQRKTISAIKDEIEGWAAINPDCTIIFSSEHLQSRLVRITEIQRLKEILDGFGLQEVNVVVYLRNPAGIANSLYSTSIKAGGNGKHPPSPQDFYFNNVCNHKKTLEKFSAVFGEFAVIPRLFQRSDLVNGSIIDDFLQLIHAPADDAYILPENLNESLSLMGIELLRRINEIIPRFTGDKINPCRADIVTYFEKYFSDEKYVMPAELFNAYDLAFRDSNEWVRRRYFPDKSTLFTVAPSSQESILSLPEESLDRLSNLIAHIWLDKQRKILSLLPG